MSEISKKALSEVELLKEIYKKLAGENPALDLNKALSKAQLLRGIAEVAKPIPDATLPVITKLTMINGATLSEGDSPDVLFIDTEVITDDIETTGLVIEVPTGYNYASMETEIGAENTVTSIAYASGELTAVDNIAPGFRAVLKFEKSQL